MPIWQILAAAVKESLGRFIAVPTIDFDTEDAPDIPAYSTHTAVSAPSAGIDPSYNPFNPQGTGKGAHHDAYVPAFNDKAPTADWETLFKNFEKNKQEGFDEFASQGVDAGTHLQPSSAAHILDSDVMQGSLLNVDISTTCIQLKGRYIVSPIKSGLMIVDQHRAHLKVLYEQYMENIDGKNVTSQSILFPDLLQLSAAQNAILCDLQPEMERIGFNLSKLSGNDWSINAVPAGIDHVDIKDTILQVIDAMESGGESITEKVYDHLALAVARSAALPYGKTLTPDEMDKLLSELLRLSNPNYTPDGKLVIKLITNEQIEKMF